MEYLTKNDNYIDLKLQDSYDHYLFKSLNDSQPEQHEDYLDFLLKDQHEKDRIHHPPQPLPMHHFIQHTLQQLAKIVSIRTTSLPAIIASLHQYFSLPKHTEKTFIAEIRRRKMKLKREYAKRKGCVESEGVVVQIKEGEVKIEQSTISAVSVDQQSVETRKKKRNRMSAQNSRDRKKQYIREIQIQNQQLKKRIEQLQEQIPFHPNTDLIKLLLCLGITVISNIRTHQHPLLIQQPFDNQQISLDNDLLNTYQIQKMAESMKIKEEDLNTIMSVWLKNHMLKQSSGMSESKQGQSTKSLAQSQCLKEQVDELGIKWINIDDNSDASIGQHRPHRSNYQSNYQ